MTKLIVGNKYVPHQKTAGGPNLKGSSVWKKAQALNQPYLYYLGCDGGTYRFAEAMNSPADFFNPEDVTPYVEELPEKWQVEITKETIDNVNRLRATQNKLGCNRPPLRVGDYNYISNVKCFKVMYAGVNNRYSSHTLLSAEQFNTYCNNKFKTDTVMSTKTQSISRKDLQVIHSNVCSKWKGKIEAKLKENLFADNIEVEESVLLEAFNEADDEQKTLLSKYFKQPGSQYILLMEESADPEIFETSDIQVGAGAVPFQLRGRSIIWNTNRVKMSVIDNPDDNHTYTKLIVFEQI